MPLDIKHGRVELAHGSGGRAMSQLLDELIIPILSNTILEQKQDHAQLTLPSGHLVTSTDCHVVSPLFFPGGNIGSLSVHGTVNDVVMSGATPLYLTLGLILEEGFALKELNIILESIAKAAKEANIKIVTGDTKVVERGQADGIYINTTGIGHLEHPYSLSPTLIKPGDKVILSGSIGEHGMTILTQRQSLNVQTDLHSDTQSLHDLVSIMRPFIQSIRCMRDPTRGGVATVLNELAQQAQLGFQIHENQIPVTQAVSGLCEMLGMDPLYLANEGKLLAVCAPDVADELLRAMKTHKKGHDAQIIGEVITDDDHLVELITPYGGTRLIDWRYSDPLPRIC